MASNLIELKDAARMLGMTPDELTDLRSKGDIYGYRDGSTWKFKIDEIERLAGSRGISLESLSTIGEAGSGIDAELEEMVDVADLDSLTTEGAGESSILVSEEELGESSDSTKSTIIGREKGDSGPDSDIQLADAEESGKPDSDIGLGSDVELVVDEASASGVKLVSGGSDALSDGSDTKAPDAGDTGKMEGEGVTLGEGDLDFDADLSLEDADQASKAPSVPSGSSVDLAEEDDDDDLVLGSGIDSDVTLATSESGINIASPMDSGLSLEEEPLELGGSAVESLELGEDDMIELEEVADPEAATQLKADDDFLLTPAEGAFDESDSGSQVIALDTEEFDETADTMLATSEAVSPLLEAEEVSPLDAGLAPAAGPSPLMAQVESAPEAPYSVWNVLSLMLIVLVLAAAGIMLVDLHRFIWSWDEPYTVSSTIMDKIIEMLGG